MAEQENHQERQQQGDLLSTPAQPQAPVRQESNGSPERPSYSPVTPTLSQASLPIQDDDQVDVPPTEWIDEPEPLPVNLDDNPDAMALRSALSILQIQRQQALQDMRDLERMKRAALADPEQFVKDLQDGKLVKAPREGVGVDASDLAAEESGKEVVSKFGDLPSAQNITRCPPVEWAKYHIVGEPLDRIHQIQQKYPGFTEETLERTERPQPHVIAAPYRPFVDRLDAARTTPNS